MARGGVDDEGNDRGQDGHAHGYCSISSADEKK